MLHILTLTWNAVDKLVKLKESLLPALDGLDYKWYIKDNASIDNTYEVASTWGPKIDIVKYKDNLQNFSEGMNFLFNRTNAKDDDTILLLNNDIIFGDTTSIKNMLSCFKDKEIGVVGARLLFTGTNKLQHAGVVFDPKYMLPKHFRAFEETDERAKQNRYFQAVTGAIMMLKASDYRKICVQNSSGINGMCERLRWAFDDIDACLAVKNMGKKIIYCGDTLIYHEESASLKKNPVNKLFMSHNVNVFKERWSGKFEADAQKYTNNSKYNLCK